MSMVHSRTCMYGLAANVLYNACRSHAEDVIGDLHSSSLPRLVFPHTSGPVHMQPKVFDSTFAFALCPLPSALCSPDSADPRVPVPAVFFTSPTPHHSLQLLSCSFYAPNLTSLFSPHFSSLSPSPLSIPISYHFCICAVLHPDPSASATLPAVNLHLPPLPASKQSPRLRSLST